MQSAWKLDDPAWIKRRNALWKANQDIYTAARPRAVANAIKAFFLRGEMENVDRPDLAIPGVRHSVWDWHGTEGSTVRLLLLPDVDEGVIWQVARDAAQDDGDIGKLLIYLLGASFSNLERDFEMQHAFAHEFGRLDGVERKIVRTLLPQRYDHEQWQAEAQAGYKNGRHHLSPLDCFNIMMECGYGYLTHYACNPHHPIQDFVEYWQQAIPYFRFDDQPVPFGGTVANRMYRSAETSALVLCQAIRHFREPRGLDGEHTPAREFRDRLFALFEQGTGCAELDAVWRQSAGQLPHRLPCPSHGDGSRALIGQPHQPSVIRKLHDCMDELRGAATPFDADACDVVDVAALIDPALTRLLGYEEGQAVPAYHFVWKVPDSFHVSPPSEVTRWNHLFWFVPAPAHELSASTPRMLVSDSFNVDLEYTWPVFDKLRERQLYWLMRQRHGIPFVRADCNTQRAKWPKPPQVVEIGVERFMLLTYGLLERSDGYTEEEDEDNGRRIVELIIPPWSGQHAGVDRERFVREVMAV